MMRRNVTRRKAFVPLLAPLLILGLAACDLLGGSGPDIGDPTKPSVRSVSPADGSEDIATDVTVSATLELPNGSIDQSTVNGDTVTLTQNGTDVAAQVTTSGNTITLDPTDLLSASTAYTFSMTTAVKDQSGAALAEAYSSTFTTQGDGTNPPPPPPPPPSGELAPSAERLVFETQNNQISEPQTLTLTNVGEETFSLSSLAPESDQFTLTETPSLPVDIAPDESVEIAVAFKPTSLGPQTTTLTLNGDSSLATDLRGLSVIGDEGNNEPSLQWIFDTFDLSLSTGDENPADTPIVDAPEDAEARSELLNGPLGNEVIIQRFQKAGMGDVSVEVLAAYGLDSSPVVEFGWYEAGDKSSRTEVFEIEGGTGNAQTLNPDTVPADELSFDPGGASFGFYSIWPGFDDREIYTQDSLNDFSDAIPHQVRAYPLPGENNAYVLATEEFTQGYDYNDIVVIVRNVKPSEEGETCNQVEPVIASRVLTASFGDLSLQNPSGAPFADRLVFSRIGDISGDFGGRNEPFVNLKCHNLNVLRLENTGSSTLTISDLTITGPASDKFILPNGESSLSIAPNDTEDLIVQFTEDEGDRGIREATLQMQTPSGTVEVELAGIYQQAPEGGREEYLGGVVEAFGYSTDMGTNSRGEIESAEPPGDPNFERAGDEVISQFWQRANPNEPVYIRQLAAFHSCCSPSSNDDMRVVERDSNDMIGRFEHAEVYGQSVLPPLQGAETKAAEMFVEPSEPFELIVRNSYSTDWIGGSSNNNNLGVRLWPVERNGSRDGFENTYIVAQDFVSGGCGTTDTANCDFNDNMYLITNVSPVSAQ